MCSDTVVLAPFLKGGVPPRLALSLLTCTAVAFAGGGQQGAPAGAGAPAGEGGTAG